MNIQNDFVEDTNLTFPTTIQENIIDENHIIFSNSENFEFYGTNEQRCNMFRDWALYFSEIKNPKNTVMNTFFKSKYAPLGEVLDTIREPLGKNGLSIIQAPLISNGEPAVKSIVTHKDGGILVLPIMSAKAIKNDVQGIVASISYIRRVVVNSLAGVIGDQEDDDGNSASDNKKKEAQTPKEPTKEELELKEKQEEILKSATEQIEKGIDKELVYQVISDNNSGKKNPNAIKDVDVANKVLAEIKKLKITKKDKKVEENVSE